MRIGTVLTVITVAAVIAAVIAGFLNGGLQESRELALEDRDMPPPSQEEVDLYRQGQLYTDTFQIFSMDSELDEGECNTLSDLAEPLADRIANYSASERDYAEHLSEVIDWIEKACQ